MLRTDSRGRDGSRRVLGAGLALGLIAEITLHGPALGIGVPIVVASVLAAGWWVRRRGRALDPLDGWLPVAAIVLATFVAIRADPLLAAVDVLLALAMVGGTLAAMSGIAVTRRSMTVISTMAVWGLGAAVLGAATTIHRIGPIHRELRGSTPAWVGPVGRGLLFGLPLAAIFAVLFASADPIFRGRITDVLGLRLDLGELPGRLLFILAAAWLFAGSISIAATGIPIDERASLCAATGAGRLALRRSLGSTEALVMLIVVDVVIAAFVGLQVAYLFGGLDTLQAAGMPYSQYARRGFFELVAAACLASTIVVVLEGAIQERTRLYAGSVSTLIALTGAVLVSAALRLNLYQAAYGWTELRLYVYAAIVAVAVGLAIMLALVLLNRTRWLPHALVILGIVSLVSLNLLAPAAFVAARNVERVVDSSLVPPDGHSGLDADYLAVLPDDAVPVLVEVLVRLPSREADEVRSILLARRLALTSDPAYRSPFAWNLGREGARSALATLPGRR